MRSMYTSSQMTQTVFMQCRECNETDFWHSCLQIYVQGVAGTLPFLFIFPCRLLLCLSCFHITGKSYYFLFNFIPLKTKQVQYNLINLYKNIKNIPCKKSDTVDLFQVYSYITHIKRKVPSLGVQYFFLISFQNWEKPHTFLVDVGPSVDTCLKYILMLFSPYFKLQGQKTNSQT